MNLTPRGCSNIGGGLALVMEESRSEMMKFFCSYGYAPFNPAEFQLLEGTLKNLSKSRRERVIALNTPYGEPCCLRADITLSALSYMAAHHAPDDFPLRLCYAERVFSSPKPPKENLEDTQIGVELLGWEGPGADVEIIAIALKALDMLGLGNSVVVLGDASILPSLFSDIPRRQADLLLNLLQKGQYQDYSRAIEPMEGLSSSDKKILKELPWLKGGTEILRDAAPKFFEGRQPLLAPLLRLADSLESLGCAERVRIDLGFVRDLDYYNGPIFNVYSSPEGELLGGGGRYHGTVPERSFSCQASGFGLSLRELATARRRDEGEANALAMIWAGVEDDAGAMKMASRFAEKNASFEISWNPVADESRRMAEYRGCRWWIDLPGGYAEEIETGRRVDTVSSLSLLLGGKA